MCIKKGCLSYNQRISTIEYKFYQDSVDELRSIFDRLTIIADGMPCVRVKDPVAKAYVLNWDKDGDGYVSEDEAAQEIYLSPLAGNTKIVTFDEFNKFRYSNVADQSWFKGCTSLRSASLPLRANAPRTTVPNACFYHCTSLEKVYLPNTIVEISGESFSGCSSLKEFDFAILPNIAIIYNGAFLQCGLEKVELPKTLTSLGASVFNGCQHLKTVIARCENLPAYGGNMTFANCSALDSFVIYQEIPPTLGWNCFQNTFCMFYVPDNAISAYKSASGWSGMQSRIKPISEYKG